MAERLGSPEPSPEVGTSASDETIQAVAVRPVRTGAEGAKTGLGASGASRPRRHRHRVPLRRRIRSAWRTFTTASGVAAIDTWTVLVKLVGYLVIAIAVVAIACFAVLALIIPGFGITGEAFSYTWGTIKS